MIELKIPGYFSCTVYINASCYKVLSKQEQVDKEK